MMGLLELVWKPDAGGLVLVRVIVPCAGRTGLPEVLVRVMLLKLGPISGVWERISRLQLVLLGWIWDLGRWNELSIFVNHEGVWSWLLQEWMDDSLLGELLVVENH